MFCPKCGTAALAEDQRFCKSCGTNLQAINDALERGESKTGVLGFNVGEIVKTVKENIDVDTIVKNVKESVGEVTINQNSRRAARRQARRNRYDLRKAGGEATTGDHYDNWLKWEETKTRIAEQKARRKELQTPKPKEWLTYSWQHNLRQGLTSLLSGAGLGIFFYYVGRAALDAGVIQQIEASVGHPVFGLEQIFRLAWLLAIFPVLKGLGQLIYAAFFAESIATLAERFAPRLEAPHTDPMPSSRDTAPQGFVSPTVEALPEPPPSVTEGTTKFFDDAPVSKTQV
ncbi:MAG: hypothetical protein HY231_12865 [Acidobacteria bacterium]|nr:hypothetical protein [Acidobacteriota bacterium]